MKRRLGWAVAVVAVAIAILAGCLALAANQRGRQRTKRQPPTIRDLKALKMTLQATATLAQGEAGPEDSLDVPLNGKGPTPRPSCLAAPSSLLELALRFKTAENRKARFKAALYEASEVITAYVSPEEVGMWAWYQGREMLALGDWDAARRCYWDALDANLSPHITRDSCAKLAWLERDPEMAHRYLELSCEGDSVTYLRNALDLCLVTGSNALAEHYLARLRAVNPQLILRSTHLQDRLESAGIAWEMDDVN